MHASVFVVAATITLNICVSNGCNLISTVLVQQATEVSIALVIRLSTSVTVG